MHLARGGKTVLLADRARFPRDKPCGGGLTGRALKQAPCDVTPVVERVVDTFELRLHYKRSFRRTSSGPLILMTQRRRLDAYLAEQAAAAGAIFRDGVRVDALAIGAEGITARVGETDVTADTLVGADGANGIVAKAAGLEDGIVCGVALEGNVGWEHLDRERFASTAVVELGQPDGGYGWLFPKGDHANVGVGGWDSEGPHLRDHLRRVCERHDIAWSSLTEIRGHRLPMRNATTRVASGRALAVGDAAGLVDPLSGDGMYEAFSSAHVAAACVRDVLEGRAADLSAYPAGLDAALGRHTSLAWIAKAAIERTPGLALRVARSRAIRRRFLLRTATSRDPLGRSAPHPVWGRAEGAARRLLGPEAG